MASKTKSKSAIKPTTMRIPDDLLKACSQVARKKERSRSWLVNTYIREGLLRDGAKLGQPRGALD